MMQRLIANIANNERRRMSIYVDWGNQEETLIVWKMGQQWDAEDFIQARQQTRVMIASKPHEVAIIADIRHTLRHPRNILPLLRGSGHTPLPNMGLIIVVSRTSFWSRLLQQMGVHHLKVHFVEDLDAAYAQVAHLMDDDDYRDTAV